MIKSLGENLWRESELMRKTKIICTLGPATDRDGVLEKMIKKGMNVARLNFSHGTHSEHLKRLNEVKRLREKLSAPVAIMLDTKGPEIRIGCFENKSVILEEGQLFSLSTDDVKGNETIVGVSYKNLHEVLNEGDTVLIDDGLIELSVKRIIGHEIECTVKNGGKLSDKKSINLPDITLDMPYMTEKDKMDLLFGIENDVDFVAASFVRNKNDIREIRDMLDKNGGENIKIIAKIENKDGVRNAQEILEIANGLMVARGDMGVEISFEQLPKIQKQLIKMCLANGKIAITATQMLDSMIKNPRPTRAEVSDVANAIYDGTSAIMLSGETAAGAYPVESLTAMEKIAETTERNIHYNQRFKNLNVKNTTITDAVCHAACTTAIDLGAKAIASVTRSGHTARMVSKYRSGFDIIAMTLNKKTFYQLALTWGANPIMNEYKNSTDELFASTIEKAVKCGIVKKGDTLVITAGAPGDDSVTNLLKALIIE